MKKLTVYQRGAVENAPPPEFAVSTGDVTGGSFARYVAESAAAARELPLVVVLAAGAYRLVPGERAEELRGFVPPEEGVLYSRVLGMKYVVVPGSPGTAAHIAAFDDRDTIAKKAASAIASGAEYVVCRDM